MIKNFYSIKQYNIYKFLQKLQANNDKNNIHLNTNSYQ